MLRAFFIGPPKITRAYSGAEYQELQGLLVKLSPSIITPVAVVTTMYPKGVYMGRNIQQIIQSANLTPVVLKHSPALGTADGRHPYGPEGAAALIYTLGLNANTVFVLTPAGLRLDMAAKYMELHVEGGFPGVSKKPLPEQIVIVDIATKCVSYMTA